MTTLQTRVVGTLESVSPNVFATYFGEARLNMLIESATSAFNADDNPIGTLYRLADDGLSGYAVRPTGELVYVFSTVKGRGADIVRDAIENGATNLDCFDGYLTSFYARHGFVETAREANWTAGAPDVVWMSLA